MYDSSRSVRPFGTAVLGALPVLVFAAEVALVLGRGFRDFGHGGGHVYTWRSVKWNVLVQILDNSNEDVGWILI